MKDLVYNKESGNLGGIHRARFILPEDLLFVDDIIDHEIDTILVNELEQIREIDLVQEGSLLNEKQIANNIYETEIELNVAKEEIDKVRTLSKLNNNKIMLIITSNNSLTRIIGTNNNYCRIFSSFNSGQKVAELNSYKLNINYKSRFYNPFLTGYLGTTFECLNPEFSKAFRNFQFTVSIEIRNNSRDEKKDVEQIFELEGMDPVSIIHDIPAKSNVKYETSFLIPTDATDTLLLKGSGICDREQIVPILNAFSYSELTYSAATPLCSLTLSVEIRNNRNIIASNVEQTFALQGIGEQSITHNINALDTEIFEVNIELPSIIEDYILLELTGAAEQQVLIPVKTGNLLFDSNTIVMFDSETQLISE